MHHTHKGHGADALDAESRLCPGQVPREAQVHQLGDHVALTVLLEHDIAPGDVPVQDGLLVKEVQGFGWKAERGGST